MSALGFGELVCVLGVVHGVFLAVVLWTHPRGRVVANRLLAAVVFLYSLQLLEIVLYWSRALLAVPHYWGVSWFFPYLYGPLLLLYGGALTDPRFALRGRQLAHLAPFAAATASMLPFYLSGAQAKAASLERNYAWQGEATIGAGMLVFWLAQFLHFAVYLALTLRRTGRSDQIVIRRWLRGLMAAFSVTFACWFFYGMAVAVGFPYQRTIDVIAVLAMTATIYAVGTVALRQPEIVAAVSPTPPPLPKYSKSTLSEAETTEYAARLSRLMVRSKPFRDPELRLEGLAGLMGIRAHQLSQVINQRFGQNFNDFINRYRVEEAKALMADPERQSETLLSLCFEAGFNNKTSFNQAFKKFTKVTPSDFREQLSNGRQQEKRQHL